MPTFTIRSATIFLFLTLHLACTDHSDKTADLFSFKLKTLHSADFSLQQLSQNKVSVFVFLSPECPMCQNYSLTLNQLSDKYKTDSIYFYGVFTGKNPDVAAIKTYLETYKINFNLLIDENKQLAGRLGAGITPEAFIINNKAEVLYKGSIDNWLVEPGQKRTIITEHYLDDALQAIVSKTEIKVKQTEAKGCLIE